jgi:hypothetical protein
MLGKKEISGALEHRIDTVTNIKCTYYLILVFKQV